MPSSNDPRVLAYMAGVIDSDGCITIQKAERKGGPQYNARIAISGTRRAVHDLAVDLWGGKTGEHRPANASNRVQFNWQRHGRQALRPIADVMPYLRLKHHQAEAALELECFLQAVRSGYPAGQYHEHLARLHRRATWHVHDRNEAEPPWWTWGEWTADDGPEFLTDILMSLDAA